MSMMSHEQTVEHSAIMRNQRQESQVAQDSIGQQGSNFNFLQMNHFQFSASLDEDDAQKWYILL